MTLKEFILGRDTETEVDKLRKKLEHERAEQIAQQKKAEIMMHQDTKPLSKMTFKEFILGRDTETEEEKRIKRE